jgi:hypothetical protein
MPVTKEVSFIIKKYKCPILGMNGKFEMAVMAHNGLSIGQCDDFNTVSAYLKSFGEFEKDAKKGWIILGQHYDTIQPFETKLYTDPVFGAKVRADIIERMTKSDEVIQPLDEKQEEGA